MLISTKRFSLQQHTEVYLVLNNSVEQLLMSCRNKNIFKYILSNTDVEAVCYKDTDIKHYYTIIENDSLLGKYVIDKSDLSRSEDFITVYVVD